MSRMLTVRKVAKMLGVTTYTVRNWAKTGKIRAIKIPNCSTKSQWFIPEKEIFRIKNEEIIGDVFDEKEGNE